jgi:hypothetical protein
MLRSVAAVAALMMTINKGEDESDFKRKLSARLAERVLLNYSLNITATTGGHKLHKHHLGAVLQVGVLLSSPCRSRIQSVGPL